MKFTRITVDPGIFFGKPCIRGLRFPVSRILGLLSAGETKETILKAYPYLEPQDIDETLASRRPLLMRKSWSLREVPGRHAPLSAARFLAPGQWP